MSRNLQGTAWQHAAGSPVSGEPLFLAVGKLRHAHGVKGEILMQVLTDFPERLQPGEVLYLGPQAGELKLVKRRPHKDGLLVSFEGYTTPEAVGELRNQVLFVKAADRPPLAEGEYYHHQLVNMEVISDAGEPIGTVAEILETGASDVLVIRPMRGADVLIPFSDAFIRKVDLAMRVITVHIIPGLLGEEP